MFTKIACAAALAASIALVSTAAEAAQSNPAGATARDSTHMVLVKNARYTKRPVTCSVDQGKLKRRQISIVFNGQ
jgi:hypothetical protein